MHITHYTSLDRDRVVMEGGERLRFKPSVLSMTRQDMTVQVQQEGGDHFIKSDNGMRDNVLNQKSNDITLLVKKH